MDKKLLCAIYDKKAETYDGYSVFPTLADALRAFQLTIEKHPVYSKWPEDYAFIHLADIFAQGEKIDIKTDKVYTIAEAKDYIVKPNAELAKKNK